MGISIALHVSYDKHPDLELQTVKYGGINISVQDLSSEPTNGKDQSSALAWGRLVVAEVAGAAG
jgi:hypothetical protein